MIKHIIKRVVQWQIFYWSLVVITMFLAMSFLSPEEMSEVLFLCRLVLIVSLVGGYLEAREDYQLNNLV